MTTTTLDTRSLALSFGSRQILTGLKLWSQIETFATPIQHVHVSDQGRFGAVRIHARDEDLPALGYLVDFQKLLAYLRDQVVQAGVDVFSQTQITEFTQQDAQVSVKLSRQQPLNGRLLIAAEGNHSLIRAQLQTPINTHDYGQSALVTTVQLEKAHENWAFERFTRNGPLAILPKPDRTVGVVWSLPNTEIERVKSLPDALFLSELQQAFGYRLGVFQRCGKRQSFPLVWQQAKYVRHERILLCGNAAHSIHPVAGQGYNLSVRDIATLLCLFDENTNHHLTSVDQRLAEYVQQRGRDQGAIERFCHGVLQLFGTDFPIFANARGHGLRLLQRLPFAQRQLARLLRGQLGKMNRLQAGLPLDGRTDHD